MKNALLLGAKAERANKLGQERCIHQHATVTPTSRCSVSDTQQLYVQGARVRLLPTATGAPHWRQTKKSCHRRMGLWQVLVNTTVGGYGTMQVSLLLHMLAPHEDTNGTNKCGRT
jgi:hypothetical protein